MPTTLAPPPPRLARPVSRPGIDPPSVSFTGRSLAEYSRAFDLDLPALRGRDVLDVAAGPASFTAEARARRISAVAVDPAYDRPLAQLVSCVHLELEQTLARLRATWRPERAGAFASFETFAAERRAAAGRFLGDYETHVIYNRYVAGALPLLPFFDGTFDLVLCADLLFTRANGFDFDWHLAAGRELVRVTADEVRIQPLCGADGRPFPGLARLRRELRAGGIASEVRPLARPDVTGVDTMLVLRKGEP